MSDPLILNWPKPSGQDQIPPRSFRCGHCGHDIGSNQGYMANHQHHRVYLCPYCSLPTYVDVDSDRQFPGVASGNDVAHLPVDIAVLYREARDCVAVSAFTASVLACRKILMNVAVAQGADEDKPFIEYVEYLANSGFIPPNGRGWVDHIRRKGNEATHEIQQMTRDDAERLITFIEMLLRFVYEFPATVPQQVNVVPD